MPERKLIPWTELETRFKEKPLVEGKGANNPGELIELEDYIQIRADKELDNIRRKSGERVEEAVMWALFDRYNETWRKYD